MSWERDTKSAKYESIQDSFTVDFFDEEDSEEVSLEKLMEIEIEEMELDEDYDN
jgi:hypothetical protein